MPSNRSAAAGKPRKSPLRLTSDPVPAISPAQRFSPAAAFLAPDADRTPQSMRKMMISEFCEWLRTRTNKHNRPFQEGTIAAYSDAAIALSGWMGKQKIEKDFTGCDTAVLNRFFRWYYDTYGQSGTNTKQRNLRHLFSWLAAVYDHPHPYTDQLARYAPVQGRPSTLTVEFIQDLLEATGAVRRGTSRMLAITRSSGCSPRASAGPNWPCRQTTSPGHEGPSALTVPPLPAAFSCYRPYGCSRLPRTCKPRNSDKTISLRYLHGMLRSPRIQM
jgi:hypothetical protein